MGIFSKRIEAAYPATTHIVSPWSPQTGLQQWAIDEALKSALTEHKIATVETALRIPAVKRAWGLNVGEFAGITFYQMNVDERTDPQPAWLTSSASGVSVYNRQWGIGNDLFFWACALVGFTIDGSDCLHIPFGMWSNVDGRLEISDSIPAKYHARPVLIHLGPGQNGFMVDGIDLIREAMDIQAAYRDRLKNPVPLTVLNIPWEIWQNWTPEERAEFRTDWITNRQSANGSTAMKPDTFGIDMPALNSPDLFESGRNANRLDIANMTSVPASLLEGVRQGGGGGGTDVRYTGVANGGTANELWRFGEPRRYTLAFESRMSMDDVSPVGLSIRGDLTDKFVYPEPTIHTPNED